MSPTLVACGFDPATNAVYQPAEGTNFRESAVDVLNAVVVADDSGEGRVIATLVNNNQDRDDALTGLAGSGRDSSVEVDFGSRIDVGSGDLVNLANVSPILASGSAVVPGSLVTLRWTFANAEAVTFQAVVVDEFGPFAELGPGSGPDQVEVEVADPEGSGGFEFGQGGNGGTAPSGE